MEAPISFEEVVCATLATLRLDQSVATGQKLAVDTAAFLNAAQRAPNASPTLKE